MTTALENTASLAEQINAEHEACNVAAGEALRHAMNAGDLLRQAKRLCPHGQWQGWLAENFSGSARTARVYMRLADHRAQLESKMADTAVLSIDGALRLLATTSPPYPIFDANLRAAEIDRQFTLAQKRFRSWRRRSNEILQNDSATFSEVLTLQREAHEVTNGWSEYFLRCKRHIVHAAQITQSGDLIFLETKIASGIGRVREQWHLITRAAEETGRTHREIFFDLLPEDADRENWEAIYSVLCVVCEPQLAEAVA